MCPDRSLELSVGELCRSQVAFHTSQATALVAEVCRYVFYSELTRAPHLDDILLSPDGSIGIQPASPASDGDLMGQLAALLEAVLPPLGAVGPEFSVRASLRLLAPRARQLPGLPPILAPESLAAELDRFTIGNANDALRELWTRADKALHQYLPEPQGTERVRADAVRDHAKGTPPATPVLDERITCDDDNAVPCPSSDAIVAPGWRRRSSHVLYVLAVSLMLAIGFGGGAWLGRHSYPTVSHALVRADARHPQRPRESVAVRSPGSGASNGPAESGLSSALSADSAMTPAPLQVPGLKGPAFSPSFSEDGREIIFHVGRDPVAQIASARLEPGQRTDRLVLLSNDRSRTYHARRSPDGQLVAFDSDRDGERAVYVATRDWSQVRKVSGVGLAALPSWSPDMKWLALVRAEPKHPRVWNLWLQDLQSGALTRLTQHRFGQTWNASWFPDSKLVCYSHEDRLVVLDITTRRARVFPSPKRRQLVRTPAVSPDGTRIIFQVYKNGVWLLDLTNGSMRRVLDDTSAEEFAWDPRGEHVAYHSRRDGQWRLWMMTAPSA